MALISHEMSAENTRLREALAFYADPDTYDQVDLLGRCGLSDDTDAAGNIGRRAREVLGLGATAK